MKRLFIILVISGLLVSMPVGLSDCDCGNSSREYQPINTVVGDNAAAIYSIDELCGLVEPDDWWVDASFDPCTPTRDLPDTLDWRDMGGVDYTTPVKNQGSCGSCWAFGTIGSFESKILIEDGVEVDLSEQWLVSCNRNGWSCGGGWWAHDYHQWKTDSFDGTGAVLEENFPYGASNVPCDGPYQHDYFIDSWSFIGWGGQGVPSTDAIKQAIMDHGPVSVAVSVNSAFGGYTGGVFNNNSNNINHAVVLVGWDDNQGAEGVWFLRNSWGPGWGEDGYMRIEYDCSKVGYAANYVEYPLRTNLEINGGPWLTVGIRNVGDEETSDIEWSIIVEGGLLNNINTSLNGNIPRLKPNKVIRKIIPLFGIGQLKITVTAWPSDAGKVTKTVNALTFFGLSIILPF